MVRMLAAIVGMAALTACATDNVAVRGPSPGASALQKPAYRLSDVAGKQAADLDALLGAPDLTRNEGSGEFRRYSLASCALIIILYPDESGVKRAASVNAGALKSGDEKPDLDLCLAEGRGD